MSPTMASEESEKTEERPATPSPASPSERPEDNVSSIGQADTAMVGHEPMATWRLTLVLAWYEEILPSMSMKLKLTARPLALAWACSCR